MVPWLQGRPLTLERYPNGVDEKGFMQKNASSHFPSSIERIEVPKNEGTINHPLVGDSAGLTYLANQGTVTFHIWTSRLPHLDHPDHLVLDLDPSDDGLDRTREAVVACRRVLAEFGMSALLVASGSKGFHLWTPLVPTVHHAEVGRALWCLAALIAQSHPQLATVEFLKRNRGDRVFIDWLRNRPGASIVAPYSLRPLPSAPVATPLRWEELYDAEPGGVTITSIRERLADPPQLPPPVELDVEGIVAVAQRHGIDPDQTVDRFGRKRS
jgi:bifunctional non-homologous end joining protein LigD